MVETWSMLEWERRRLAEDLEALGPDDWERPTRCGDWTVRDVVGHVSGLPNPLRAMVGLIAKLGNVDAFIDQIARERGRAEPERLIADLRDFATSRQTPPGVSAAGSLIEVLVHGDDIRQVVGGTVDDRPAEHLVRALDEAVVSRPPFRGRERAKGLRLAAPDVDWEHGAGPPVEGPGLDLLCALLGREDATSALRGPGVRLLVQRCR